MITCDEIIDAETKYNDEQTKTFPTNFKEKKVGCKTKKNHILLYFTCFLINHHYIIDKR